MGLTRRSPGFYGHYARATRRSPAPCRAVRRGAGGPELNLDAASLGLVQRMLPGAARPVVTGHAFGRPVFGGVKGAEARVEVSRVERGSLARGHDAGNVTSVRQQFLQESLPLRGAD